MRRGYQARAGRNALRDYGIAIVIALALMWLFNPAEAQIQVTPEGDWSCVEIIDGEDVLISHGTEEQAVSCMLSHLMELPGRQFEAVSRERTQGVVNLSPEPEPEPPIPEPPVFERKGVLQELLFQSDSFRWARGAQVDNFAIHTMQGDDRLVSGSGTYGDNWDSKRVNLFAETGIRGVEQFAYRQRLVYSRLYDKHLPYPRSNIYMTLGGGYNNRLKDDTEYWWSETIVLPKSYEIEKTNNREIFLQFHNVCSGRGHLELAEGNGQWLLMTHTSTTEVCSGPETKQWRQDIASDIGEVKTWVYHFRFNPYSKRTTVPAGIHEDALTGKTFEGGKGFLEVWTSMAPGASGTSATLGKVTNNTAQRRMMKVVDHHGPIGKVPSAVDGKEANGSILIEINLNKPMWQLKRLPPPRCPHSGTSKCKTIDIYRQAIRIGDATSDYRSVHPLKEPIPR